MWPAALSSLVPYVSETRVKNDLGEPIILTHCGILSATVPRSPAAVVGTAAP
jgi:hypothetical protein